MTSEEIGSFLDAFKDAIGPCYSQICWTQDRRIDSDGKRSESFRVQVLVPSLGLWTNMLTSTYMNETPLEYVVLQAKRDFEEALEERRHFISQSKETERSI